MDKILLYQVILEFKVKIKYLQIINYQQIQPQIELILVEVVSIKKEYNSKILIKVF